MGARSMLLERIVEMVGSSCAKLIEAGDGWPGLVDVMIGEGIQPVAIHVGTVGLSGRGRDDVERRFQNPGQGKPVEAPSGHLPVLVGLWDQGERPVLVGMDAVPRVGKETRQSLFISLAALEQGAKEGWGEYHSDTGELVIAFHPSLLPTYVELRRKGAGVASADLRSVIGASGLNDTFSEEAAERARRATTQLVREEAFRRDVVSTYAGLCAMCGLNFGLVQGAHIYPAGAPSSPDKAWNGLALCGNHHSAFDKHRLWVNPADLSLRIHPDITVAAPLTEAGRRFVEVTFPKLAPPRDTAARPRPEMFAKRYMHFSGRYDWASTP